MTLPNHHCSRRSAFNAPTGRQRTLSFFPNWAYGKRNTCASPAIESMNNNKKRIY
jgi:hypothetical protein